METALPPTRQVIGVPGQVYGYFGSPLVRLPRSWIDDEPAKAEQCGSAARKFIRLHLHYHDLRRANTLSLHLLPRILPRASQCAAREKDKKREADPV
jgi:hypothetical protein